MMPLRLRHVFATLLCLGAWLSSPNVQAGPTIEHWQTPSGVPVYFVASRSLPMLDVRVDFRAGSAADPQGQAGLASLTHTLLDLGAGGDDEATLARRMADLGAQLSGGVELDRASLSLRTLTHADKLPQAMAVLRQILAQPHFDEAVLQREKQRMQAELDDALTRPDTQASRAFWASLYPQHPYGQQASRESLAPLSARDVKAFYDRHYQRSQAVITLVGDLDRAHAEKLAAKLGDAIPAGTGAPGAMPPAAPSTAAEQVHIDMPSAQTHLLLGMPMVARGDPDFFPLLVGNYSLGGGGFVSRLMQEVREKRGYAYSVYSYFMPLRVAGPFQIGLQTKPSQAKDALAVVDQVLRDFVAHGPSQTELIAAKANLAGSFPLRLDSNRKLLDNVATIGFYGLPLDWLDQYQARVQAVTRSQIQEAFKRHLNPEQLHTVSVGAPSATPQP